jgi:hypothetical protein
MDCWNLNLCSIASLLHTLFSQAALALRRYMYISGVFWLSFAHHSNSRKRAEFQFGDILKRTYYTYHISQGRITPLFSLLVVEIHRYIIPDYRPRAKSGLEGCD